ncbi:transposase [Bacillus cereus]|uniref:Transposase n=4 Tax=Bacillus TaxID=1386 RepID=A0A9X0MB10_BACCE|nr:tyrosine-type recombinase/integrase [Bacillus cereus]KXY28654.1 transposase [Bacillus cereus]MCU5695839.1 tyrosine-type recombinase/integrase [Bacillus cereus]HDR5276896.1 tyrosine-type recombinase/integrase [Bacillus thuringiensis]
MSIMGAAIVKEKQEEINDFLIGYWENDIWSADYSAFDEFRQTIWDKTYKKIDFSCFKSKIKAEIKFFILNRLKVDDVRLYQTVIKRYAASFKHIAELLNQFYPYIKSIIDIDLNRAIIQLRSMLVQKGLKIREDGSLTKYETFLKVIYLFYKDYYDERDEFEKDIWDIRKIAKSKVVEHEAHYLLNFTAIPSPFRNMIKRYIKFRIQYVSHGQSCLDIRSISLFLNFIYEKYPNWNDLSLLSRKDMENYRDWQRIEQELHQKAQRNYLITLRVFLETIEKLQYIESPKIPASLLLFKEDIPQLPRRTENDIKYIPEGILQQLESHLEHLTPKEYIPVVILLRATGWRISDILTLHYDTCLEQTAQGWYLCGDIMKTQVLNHRVPITDDVAAIVQTVIECMKKKSNLDNNPKKFLFVRLSGKRKGRPPESRRIQNSLNKLAKSKNIIDEKGNVFHFKSHAFRHTKGVELINNGMNILHVQKWLAHASPEMTLTYAKILDTTLRKSWEDATAKGLFRINDFGKPVKVHPSDIENEDIIEWEYIRSNLDAVRMPLGYCTKPIKQPCPTQSDPCLSCRNLCTTPEFAREYERQIKDTEAVIERGKTINRPVWIEKNQEKLERLKPIYELLIQGKIHHKAGKKGREYDREEFSVYGHK